MALADDRGGVGRFRLFGVEVRINPSWLVMALLIAWSLATGAFPQIYKGLSAGSYWLMALIVVVGLGLSILLHEMAHTLVGRAFGIRVGRITLFLFGGVASLREEPRSAVSELAMAVAGPLFSIVASLVLAVCAGLSGVARLPQVAGALAYLATLNLVLAIFNMTPAFPLDGGRALRAVIWLLTGSPERATAIAARISGWISLAMIAAGVFGVLAGAGLSGLWWVLIGFFLRYAARASEADVSSKRLLRGVPLGRIATRDVQTVPAAATLEEFIDRRVYPTRHKIYPVMLDGACIGTIQPETVLRIPRAQWRTVTVGDVVTPLADIAALSPSADAAEALARMQAENQSHLLLMEDGRVTGIVTLEDLVKLVDFELKLEAAGRAPRTGPAASR